MISLIARLAIKEGREDEAIDLFKDLMKHVAEEEGTLYYTLNQGKKNPAELVVIERYTDKNALEHHSSTAYFKEFNDKIAGLLAAKPVLEVMEELHSI
ncbi:MAG: antibiotic biosynthesis monooxygenase [Deltaproteobacteria bacterium]|nr:antibiotic biosynthesis monooxygenase [Deltaproteobacteria bacterium]